MSPTAMSLTMMPAGTAEKFHEDGSVKRFPGNTVVSAVAPDSGMSQALADVAGRLQASSVAGRLTFLPRSSYHMTVFEGICADHRDAARWPRDLAEEASLEAAHAFVDERIASVEGIAAPLTMTALGLSSWPSGLVVELGAVTPDEDRRLRALRDRLSEATGLRKPGHETYRFHITLAYWLSRPDDEAWRNEHATIGAAIRASLSLVELPAPDFCHFEDMHAFIPRRSLDLRAA